MCLDTVSWCFFDIFEVLALHPVATSSWQPLVPFVTAPHFPGIVAWKHVCSLNRQDRDLASGASKRRIWAGCVLARRLPGSSKDPAHKREEVTEWQQSRVAEIEVM